MNGTIVATWSDNGRACLAVRVQEPWGPVEYIGRVPLAWEEPGPDGSYVEKRFLDLARSEQKARLVAAVKATRDAQTTEISPALPAISGQVAL